MSVETYNIITVFIYSVSAIIAFSMLGVAIRQLTSLTKQVTEAVKSNSINQLNALLLLEGQIAARRLDLKRESIALAEVNSNAKSEEFDTAELRYNEAKEMYLNSLDRLCYCVDKKLLPDQDMRLEYRDTLKMVMHEFKDDFGVATNYRNIKKIYELWINQ